jgi:hypothetical protein
MNTHTPITSKTYRTDLQNTVGSFNADKRKLLYARLAKAYGIAVQLVAMDQAEFGKLCTRQGTSAPAADENVFSAPIRILFGTKKNGKIEADKSTWKYGKCFRAAYSLGWTEADFATLLDSYKLVIQHEGKDKTLGRLIALETLDKQNHGDPEGQMTEWERKAAMNWLNRIPEAQALLDGFVPGYTAPEPGQMLGVVIQYNHLLDRWAVRGVHTDNQDRAFGLIAGSVMAEFKTWLEDKRIKEQMADLATAPPESIDDLLAALEQQNRDVRSAEIQYKLNQKLGNGDVTIDGTAPIIESQAA